MSVKKGGLKRKFEERPPSERPGGLSSHFFPPPPLFFDNIITLEATGTTARYLAEKEHSTPRDKGIKRKK